MPHDLEETKNPCSFLNIGMVVGLVEGIFLNADRNQGSSSSLDFGCLDIGCLDIGCLDIGCLDSGQQGLQGEEADAFINERNISDSAEKSFPIKRW